MIFQQLWKRDPNYANDIQTAFALSCIFAGRDKSPALDTDCLPMFSKSIKSVMVGEGRLIASSQQMPAHLVKTDRLSKEVARLKNEYVVSDFSKV